jgi:hypothetical protein
MKHLLLISTFLLTSLIASAQKSVIPSTIAPFRILNVADSTYFTPVNLNCEQYTKAILSKINNFKNSQLVFITFARYEPTKAYVKKFKLDKYPNITVGTEGYTYTVQRFYRINTTPFTAIYNKSGQLIKTFAKDPKVEEVSALL